MSQESHGYGMGRLRESRLHRVQWSRGVDELKLLADLCVITSDKEANTKNATATTWHWRRAPVESNKCPTAIWKCQRDVQWQVSVCASCDSDKGSSADASYIQWQRFGKHRLNEATPNDTTVLLCYHDRYSCCRNSSRFKTEKQRRCLWHLWFKDKRYLNTLNIKERWQNACRMNKMKMMIKMLARNHHRRGDELSMRRVHTTQCIRREIIVGLDVWTRGWDGVGDKLCGNGWGWGSLGNPCRPLLVSSISRAVRITIVTNSFFFFIIVCVDCKLFLNLRLVVVYVSIIADFQRLNTSAGNRCATDQWAQADELMTDELMTRCSPVVRND